MDIKSKRTIGWLVITEFNQTTASRELNRSFNWLDEDWLTWQKLMANYGKVNGNLIF